VAATAGDPAAPTTGGVAATIAPGILEMATKISKEGRGREILLPQALPDGWRLATDAEVEASGAEPYLEDMPATSNPEMFSVFHAQGGHADSGYAVFFTRDGAQLVVFKVDELQDMPASVGNTAGVSLDGIDWRWCRGGKGLLWWMEDVDGVGTANIEIYGEQDAAVPADVLLDLARTVQVVSVPFCSLTPEELLSLVHHSAGLWEDATVQSQRDAGEWTAALLGGSLRGFAILMWEDWGWTLAYLAIENEPQSLFAPDDLSAPGVPEELIQWATDEGFVVGS